MCTVLLLIVLPALSAQTEYPLGPVDDEEPRSVGYEPVRPADLQTTRDYQNGDLVVRSFDREKWQELVKDVDYTEESVEATPTEIPSVPPWAETLLKIFSYIIVGVAISALLYFIIRAIPFRARSARQSVEPGEETPVESLAELEIQTLLQNAIRDGNFKLAVRLYFLSLLKHLDEKGMVSWKKDKTNRDYLDELFFRDFLFDDISKLTLLYESVWYGDREVKPQAFDVMRTNFESILEKISKTGAV